MLLGWERGRRLSSRKCCMNGSMLRCSIHRPGCRLGSVCLLVLKKGFLSRVQTRSHQSSFNGYTQQKEHWGLQGSTPQTTACILPTPSRQAQGLLVLPLCLKTRFGSSQWPIHPPRVCNSLPRRSSPYKDLRWSFNSAVI